MPTRIETCVKFEEMLRKVRFARDRMTDLDCMVTTREMPGYSYGLWSLFLHLVHEAIAQRDWASLGEMLRLYDHVQSTGKAGEMYEASYVGFLEDVRLPTAPADLRKFWLACPSILLRELRRDRGIR